MRLVIITIWKPDKVIRVREIYTETVQFIGT